jgi:hypothetical protein
MSLKKQSLLEQAYALRWAVLVRDKFTCQYCGRTAPDVKLEVDHVVAREDGGDDVMENLKACCFSCNHGKAALSMMIKRGRERLLPPVKIGVKQQVLDCLTAHPKGLDSYQIAELTKANLGTIKMTCGRLRRNNLVGGSGAKGDKWLPRIVSVV